MQMSAEYADLFLVIVTGMTAGVEEERRARIYKIEIAGQDNW